MARRVRITVFVSVLVLLVAAIVPPTLGVVTPDKIEWYELLSLIISAAGIIGVVISLIILAQTNREDAENKFYDRQIELGKLFVEHPEMRPYFYSGKNVTEDDVNYNRVIAMCEIILDVFGEFVGDPVEEEIIEHAHRRFRIRTQKGRVVRIQATGIQGFIIDMFENSPALCHYLETRERWYGRSLIRLMQLSQRTAPQ